MYLKTYHVNHVTQYPYRVQDHDDGGGYHTHTPAEGEVIRKGTPNNAQSRNAMELGIEDAHMAISLFGLDYYRQRRIYDAHNALMDSEVLGETRDVTLTNSENFPFNTTLTTAVSVTLQTVRKNLFYTVEVSQKSKTGGQVEEIRVTDKTLNGFKLSFVGGAKSVVVTVRVKGGMT